MADNWLGQQLEDTVWNNGTKPLVNFNFMMRVEGIYDIPLRSVHSFSMQNEYAQAQFSEEVGVKDPEPDGVWITEISEDCDISHTELAVNDVIVSVEGKNVNDYDSLNAAIAGKVGGDTVKAVCRRYQKDGTYQEFTISFQLMEDTSGNY